MPQYEYKVIKIPINQQQYYCSFMACFGWQVQNIQESVDRVVNRSMGFSNTTNYGSLNARTYFHPHTNNAATYGYSRNHGWGSQMNTEVTDVQSSLTVTLFRDTAIPYRGELEAVEKRFFAATPAYLNRCKQKDRSQEEQWSERKAVQACADDGRAILRRGKQQTQNKVTAQTQTSTNSTAQEQPVVQVPSEPPTAVIREIEVTQNVFQSNQPGLQIRLNFNIKNRKGIQVRAVAYFFDKNHQPLQDVNQRFKTADGKVSIGSTFRPGFEDCYYNSYILFLPYSELDQKDGEYRLGLNARIYDEVTKTFLASSSDVFFRYTQNGKAMRGESITSPTVKTAPVKQTKPAAKPRQKPAPVTRAKPAVPKRPSFKEYSAIFCKNYGWDVLTEDRKVFLEGLKVWYKDYSNESVKYFQKALDMNPKEPTYWSWINQQLLSDESIPFLQKGLKELPNNPSLLFSLGVAYVKTMKLDEAGQIADDLSSAEEKPTRMNYHILLGMIAEAKKDYKTALKCYDTADKFRDPESFDIIQYYKKNCRDSMKQKK